MLRKKILRKYSILRLTGKILIILFFCISINLNMSLLVPASGTKADYYSLDISSTETELTTDGKNPVEYVITITNTGNRQDTFTLYVELLEVTGCSEPDENEWSYTLDTSLVTLAPSQSMPVVLTVSTSCGCQVGCKASIEVHGVSSGDSTVHESILIFTTRGAAKKVTGLLVEIDYNSALNVIYLDTLMKFDVYIYNLQNRQNPIIVWTTEGPPSWSIGISPDEFTLPPNSKRLITLSFKIPENVITDDYNITLTAQVTDSPSMQGKDKIRIQVRPDLIVTKVVFSKSPLYANEKVKLKINVQNIGLSTANDIEVLVYDKLNFTQEHELSRKVISSLGANKSTTVTYDWKPKEGSYNITIILDPNELVEELTTVNNFRIEPVIVKKARDSDSGNALLLAIIFIIAILIIIWVIMHYRSAGNEVEPTEEDEQAPKREFRSEVSRDGKRYGQRSKMDLHHRQRITRDKKQNHK